MEEQNELIYDFGYTDNFGNKTILHKTLPCEILEEESECGAIIDEFFKFLYASGFTKEASLKS